LLALALACAGAAYLAGAQQFSDRNSSTNLMLSSGSATTPALTIAGLGVYAVSNNAWVFTSGGSAQATLNYSASGELKIGQSARFAWASGALPGSGPDLVLTRDAAGRVLIDNASGSAGQIRMTATAFASLGTPTNGTLAYCNDCTIANPCASGGSGALAKRLNNTWVCN
jgi:hypothetical protein